MLSALDSRADHAKERAWLHDRAACQERRVELLEIISDQATVAQTGPPPCACCGYWAPDRGWRILYRCFECDLWFCPACSRVHFKGGDRAAGKATPDAA